MTNQAYELIVLGGGPGGYTAALRAAKLGRNVALVEEQELGGTCLNRGCIPTKAYMDTAKTLHGLREAAKRGIDFGDADPATFRVDMKKVLAYKQRIVKRMTAGIGVLLRENGVRLLRGFGTVDFPEGDYRPMKVHVEGPDAGDYHADHLILATGSKPAPLPLPYENVTEITDRLLDSDRALEIDFVPERLLVIGGGVIGMEMARIFKAFGSAEVHIVEAMPRLCPQLDHEISETLLRSLKSDKIDVSLARKVVSIKAVTDGLQSELDDGTNIEASHVLVAVGRVPDLRFLGNAKPTADDWVSDRRAFLKVGSRMQTITDGVYAIGDVTGLCMLAHAAMEMGEIVAGLFAKKAALSSTEQPHPFLPLLVPGCIYGEPEVASIGLTEDQAREESGIQLAVGRFPFAANGRAVASGHPEGFVKVLRNSLNDQILGVHMIGSGVSELVNEAAMAMHRAIPARDWCTLVHAHPTLGEALLEAVADSRGEALHLPPRRRNEEGV